LAKIRPNELFEDELPRPGKRTCNKCGFSAHPGEEDFSDLNPFKIGGGYSTTFPEDLQTVVFVVCGPCLKEWVESFDVPATFEHWM
jgi:hypothetical protein